MHVELCGIAEIDAFVSRWKLPVAPPEQDPGIRFTYHLKQADGSFIICQGEVMDSITNGNQRTVHMGTPKDSKGRPTRIDGEYSFVNLNPELCTLTVADDKKSFTVAATDDDVVDMVGAIEVSADVDRGDGIKNLTESYKFVKSAGEATTFGFSADGEVPTPPVVVDPPVDVPPQDPEVPTDPA